MLQISVGREGKTFLMPALGIELYEVAGDVLDACLGTFLDAFPRSCAEGAETRCLASIRTAVLAYLI